MWSNEVVQREQIKPNEIKKNESKLKWQGYLALFVFLNLSLILALLLSISVGVAGGGLGVLFQMLGTTGPVDEIGEIMFQMRMPRAVTAALTGAAFALSGAVMQGLTRNPLADSGLLGINAGAGLMVAISAVVWPGMSSYGIMFLAFVGAALATGLVYGLGIGRKKSDDIWLILAGSAVSALLTAISQGIALCFGLAKELTFWTSGSLSGLGWDQLRLTAPWLCLGILGALIISPYLSILALGDETAAALGLRLGIIRMGGLLTVFLLAGLSVSMVGGIAFLGLIIPHIARFLVGPDYRRLMPIVAVSGAILLVLADVAARMINAPFDTPVGALVATIGVPIFLGMTYRKKGMAL